VTVARYSAEDGAEVPGAWRNCAKPGPESSESLLADCAAVSVTSSHSAGTRGGSSVRPGPLLKRLSRGATTEPLALMTPLEVVVLPEAGCRKMPQREHFQAVPHARQRHTMHPPKHSSRTTLSS
jgi:hypothetical protein